MEKELNEMVLQEEDAVYRNKAKDYKESNIMIMSFLNLSLTQLRSLHCIMSIRKKGDIFIKCNKNEFLKLAGIDKTKGHKKEISQFKKVDPVIEELKALQHDAIIKIPKEWFKNNRELYSKIHYLFYREQNDTTPFDSNIHMLAEDCDVDSNFMLNLVSGIDFSSSGNICIKLNPDALPLMDEIQREYTLWYEKESSELTKLKENSLKWYQFLRSKIGARQKEILYTVYLEPSPTNELNNVRYILGLLDQQEEKQPDGTKKWVYMAYPHLEKRTDHFIKQMIDEQLKQINNANLHIKAYRQENVKYKKSVVAVKILIVNEEFKNNPNLLKIQKYKSMLSSILKVSDTTLLKIANIMDSEEFAKRMKKDYFDKEIFEELKKGYLHFCLRYMQKYKNSFKIKNEVAYLLYMIKYGNDIWDGVRINEDNPDFYWHHLDKKDINKNINEINQIDILLSKDELTETEEDDLPF